MNLSKINVIMDIHYNMQKNVTIKKHIKTEFIIMRVFVCMYTLASLL